MDDFDATHEANKAFCRNLAVKFPALPPILKKNLEDEDGDLNTYLFASAVVEWAEANVVSRESDVMQLLAALNQGLAEGEREVPNFIAVGFGESISHETPLLPFLQGDLKGWYEYDVGISDEHPRLRSGN
ncbi:hypothetical protein ACFWHR_03185 [Leucobacter sp. NPDC058333]|uniref:DUF7674 family protein n=1 Tax=Leucobacter sp. NPDC058333 TaxID=3346450 RepID=UPI0036460A8C